MKDWIMELCPEISEWQADLIAKQAQKEVAAEREAMVALAAKQGWAMKNEDPFEDAVREIAAIRARGRA